MPEPFEFDNETEIKERSEMVLNILRDQVVEELSGGEETVENVIDALSRVLCRWGPRESFAICGTLVQHGFEQYEL